MPARPDDDALLDGVLREAAIAGEALSAVTSAYPTLDTLLGAMLEEIAEVGGADEATGSGTCGAALAPRLGARRRRAATT